MFSTAGASVSQLKPGLCLYSPNGGSQITKSEHHINKCTNKQKVCKQHSVHKRNEEHKKKESTKLKRSQSPSQVVVVMFEQGNSCSQGKSTTVVTHPATD